MATLFSCNEDIFQMKTDISALREEEYYGYRLYTDKYNSVCFFLT